MREKEREINDLKEKKQALTERVKHLKKSNAGSKKLIELEKELQELNDNQAKESEDNTDFKKFILKEAFYLRFNALQEYSEKTALIAGFGKYLVDLLDNNTDGSCDTILMDALLTVDGWEPTDQRHTLTKEDDLLSDNQGDDAVLLTDQDIKLPTIIKSESKEELEQDDYFNQLFKRVSLQKKKPISHHKSYAEFQTQFNLPTAATTAITKDSPPAYSKNDSVLVADEKK